MIDPFLIAVVFLGVLISALWFAVLRGGDGHESDKVFSLLVVGTLVWSATNYLAEVVQRAGQAYLFVAITYAIGIAIAALFFHFSYVFPTRLIKASWPIWAFYLLATFFFIISFTGLIVLDVVVSKPINIIESGPYLLSYTVGFLAMVLLGLIITLWKLFKLPKHRARLFYVLVGISLTIFGTTATNLLIPLVSENFEASRYGPLFLLFFLAFTAFAIVRHHLFSIKVLATEFLITFLSLFLIGRVFFSTSLQDSAINIVIASTVIVLGLFVIRSVMLEVRRREEVERLNRQLGDFLRFGVHELRAPLGGIRGHTSMMLEGSFGPLNTKLKRSVKIVHTQIDQLLLIVETFLNANRARSGKLEVVMEPTSLKNSVDRVLDTMNTKAELKKITLKSHIPTDLPTVKADPRKIQIVIGNVISNAIKYTQEGGITINASKVEGGVVLKITDTGIGIPKEQIPQLFTQFERGSDKAKKMATGSGIGLYLTKKLMDAMDGEIIITSDGPDKGSTVTLTFKKLNGKPRI